MKALIIGLELEWRRGTGEKKQFGSPRGRAGESNASKVETWEAARSAATSLRSLGLRTANQFSGWACLYFTALRLMSSSRRSLPP